MSVCKAGETVPGNRNCIGPASTASCLCLSSLISRLKGRAPELNLDKIRDALATSWACSGEAARRDLGFTPAKPLATLLQETIDWCLANGHL